MIKKNDNQYITSSLNMFQYFPDPGLVNLRNNERYEFVDESILDVMFFFLTPSSINNLPSSIDSEAVAVCIKEGFIVPTSQGLSIWEKYGWQRAAQLLFSQQNLQYLEDVTSDKTQGSLIEKRRKSIEDYSSQSSYPERFLVKTDKSVQLQYDGPEEVAINWEKVFLRSSVRDFSDKEVSYDDFCATLFGATKNIRDAEQSKKSGDNFFLLNSFYSWTVLYVYVQNVSNIPQGLYQFDPLSMKLYFIRRTTDKQVSNVIQNQYWIGGGGFCIFVASQWERYAWIYRHSRAYINLLIQLGEVSQEILSQAYSRGLAGWMTPAVTESKANKLFSAPPGVDIIYFMKFGHKK